MTELEILRKQLLEQQKFASLGKLSAGIAHEIQNPLNFVINFSKMSERLLADLKDIVADLEGKIEEDDAADLEDIADDLSTNMEKIKEHGERAISIIQGILLISRGKTGERLPTDIPHLVHEYVWLAYHSQRANDKSFNVSIKEDYQEGMKNIMVIPQDFSRAILNVVNNAYYAIKQRTVKEQEEKNETYVPTLSVTVSIDGGMLVITISDNGTGIPADIRKRLFRETITTKPIGHGTGLGMQITHDIIVNSHHGEISITSEEGEGTALTFLIPINPTKE